jgi:hypothetical protein
VDRSLLGVCLSDIPKQESWNTLPIKEVTRMHSLKGCKETRPFYVLLPLSMGG